MKEITTSSDDQHNIILFKTESKRQNTHWKLEHLIYLCAKNVRHSHEWYVLHNIVVLHGDTHLLFPIPFNRKKNISLIFYSKCYDIYAICRSRCYPWQQPLWIKLWPKRCFLFSFLFWISLSVVISRYWKYFWIQHKAFSIGWLVLLMRIINIKAHEWFHFGSPIFDLFWFLNLMC